MMLLRRPLSETIVTWAFGGVHRGVDLRAIPGKPCYAGADGFAEVRQQDAGFGLYVRLSLGIVALGDLPPGEVVVYYAHLSSVALSGSSQRVRRGELLGETGATGNVTGAHLHWEVRVDGVSVDPLLYVGGEEMTSKLGLQYQLIPDWRRRIRLHGRS